MHQSKMTMIVKKDYTPGFKQRETYNKLVSNGNYHPLDYTKKKHNRLRNYHGGK